MVIDNNFYMNLALKEAWKYQGLTYPNPAVGCCVVGPNGEILGLNAHQKAGYPHAEVMALKDAYYKLTSDSKILELNNSQNIHKYLIDNANNSFNDCSIYTTLEPCSNIGKTPSCANLITMLNVKKVYVGSKDFNSEAANGNKLLQDNKCEVESGILEDECVDLLYPFKKFLNDKFIFFKWAQRLDGNTNGAVSSSKSRENVHAMRDVCDLLVIGGNTVRQDRPILDARLVDGKAPDVLIYSREKEFDKGIPLFNVEGREVFIADNLSKIEGYKNIMIEGTSNMYKLTKDIVDYYLCYLAPSFGGESRFNLLDDEFKVLNLLQDEKDIIMWMKRK